MRKDIRSIDRKAHAYQVGNNVFVWWSYTDDDSTGHIVVLRPQDIDRVVECLQDQSYCGQLHHNGITKCPMELRVSGDEVCFWTLQNNKQMEGRLGRTEFLEFLTSI